jgi:hypothetical protein
MTCKWPAEEAFVQDHGVGQPELCDGTDALDALACVGLVKPVDLGVVVLARRICEQCHSPGYLTTCRSAEVTAARSAKVTAGSSAKVTTPGSAKLTG